MSTRISLTAFDRSLVSAIGRSTHRLAGVSLKLATLQRINRGSDDPAGVIAASNLAKELASYETAIRASERTRATTHVADSILASANELLRDVEGNLVAAADESLSPDAKQALQYEIDSALDAFNRLGQIEVNGRSLFDTTMTFLAGTDPNQTVSLELPALDESLGGEAGSLAELRAGGSASVDSGNFETAARIVGDARNQLLSARVELGAFERTVVDSTQRVMEETTVNLAGALSAIRDADVARETSHLVREMILAESSVLTTRLLLRTRRSTIDLLSPLLA